MLTYLPIALIPLAVVIGAAYLIDRFTRFEPFSGKGVFIFSGAYVLILALGFTKAFQISAAIAEGKKKGPPPGAVTSYVPEETTWQSTLNVVGDVTANRGTTLSAEAAGRITEINFESGQSVSAGTVLAELDSEVEKADLENAEAQLALAETSLKRQQALRKRNANSQADLDDATATLRSAQAAVARLKAIIERRTIRAPFDGKLGIRQINIGRTVQVGDPIVTLNDTSSVFIDLSVGQEYATKLKAGLKVETSGLEGSIDSVESEVDPVSRLLKLRAKVNNPDGKLLPGMVVKTRIILEDSRKVLSIPQASINYAPYGSNVYLLEESGTVSPRTVQLGEKRGDFVEVISGLNAGEKIAGSGVFKLFPGAPYIETNSVELDNSLTPDPENT